MRKIYLVVQEFSEGGRPTSMPPQGLLNHLLVLGVHGWGGCGVTEMGTKKKRRVTEMEGVKVPVTKNPVWDF